MTAAQQQAFRTEALFAPFFHYAFHDALKH